MQWKGATSQRPSTQDRTGSWASLLESPRVALGRWVRLVRLKATMNALTMPHDTTFAVPPSLSRLGGGGPIWPAGHLPICPSAHCHPIWGVGPGSNPTKMGADHLLSRPVAPSRLFPSIPRLFRHSCRSCPEPLSAQRSTGLPRAASAASQRAWPCLGLDSFTTALRRGSANARQGPSEAWSKEQGT
ncbi:hypothetical protein CC85DRAFT_109682 [Cutaneotrichosporon oleaginosum]|uniref:Uncharacterized protein n=1 Tax=Cutaneotrichosporon oleaginosum TaxID=879819 RepID=A0A0J0XKP7_9TREE|nr:uncharacterized protein CC85DRAFT_109682 [Cutaneotrichosporon oleaginosum]KLT41637.1 hypothetical protein CC85DRAFT_109682 [Cutaneotrichosporon oleaginosum]TXT08126.1 hypothetical protein COLE_05050 [Cutaneotrichosporon oleaginosum]